MRRAIPVLAVAALLAGCGGGGDSRDTGKATITQPDPLSKAAYQSAILDIRTDSTPAVAFWGDLVAEERPVEECGEIATAFYEVVRDLVGRASILEPPADVAEVHAAFVSAANESVIRAGEVAEQAAGGEVRCGRQFNDALYGLPSSKRAEDAMLELEARGYHLGLK